MDSGIFSLRDYGNISITLKGIMDERGITRNRLAKQTGLVYNTINRYYRGDPIASVDLDVLAKLCFVLECEIGDILKYQKP